MTEKKIIKPGPKSKLNIKIGDKFGLWKVIEDRTVIKGFHRIKCECACGTVRMVLVYELYHGHTKSCGCIRGRRGGLTFHGMRRNSIYNVWIGMIQRCTNPNTPGYKQYGGRGITVCDRWLKIKNFYADMGDRPPGLTIDRKDTLLGYFKENCRWATRTEQARNHRVRKGNKTGIHGVYWDKRAGKYNVVITANYKNYHIGHFVDLKDADIARQGAEQKYWT